MAAELEALREGKIDTGELDALRSEAEKSAGAIDELAGLGSRREPEGGARGAEDELEALRGIRDQRDEVAGQVEQLRSSLDVDRSARSSVSWSEDCRSERPRPEPRDRLTNELAVAREDVTRLQGLAAEREETAARVRPTPNGASRRSAPAPPRSTPGSRPRARRRAHARRRGRGDRAPASRARRTREDGERLLAAERAEVARLREEMLNSERLDDEPDEVYAAQSH